MTKSRCDLCSKPVNELGSSPHATQLCWKCYSMVVGKEVVEVAVEVQELCRCGFDRECDASQCRLCELAELFPQGGEYD